MISYRAFERLEKYVDIHATGFDFGRDLGKPEIDQDAPVIPDENIARRQISVDYSCTVEPSDDNAGIPDQFRG